LQFQVTESQSGCATFSRRIFARKRPESPLAVPEVKVADEFKSRAHMHIGQTLIPEDELTWLALMQHYGIPTRLLDFTLSPFVALYFAVRHGGEKSTPARVWAMDSEAINGNFRRVTARARIRERERKRTPGHRVSFHPDDAASERDVLRNDALAMRRAAEDALKAEGTFRRGLNEHGCVCMTMPPSFNPRLASQQGVFLLNCAEELTFEESLEKMMGAKPDWCETFDIAPDCFREVEERLFQSNIHEQSLFPDMEGLAGLVRQKTRLHWT
jgi:hypothetical protein